MARAPRRSSNGTTMAAVARHAGVSSMTVSNVVNGRPVHADTRALVLESIRALNYSPNSAARALASASTERIGLVYRSSENAFLSAVLVGALGAAERLGAQILIRRYDDHRPEAALAAMYALMAAGAGAILLPSPLCEVASGSNMAEMVAVPLIGLSPGAELPNMASVRIDDLAAARDMTARLLALGHRRIGFVRAPDSLIIGRTRTEGYCQALVAHGVTPDPALIVDGGTTFESGVGAAEYLLELATPPTAIFATNDDMAAAVAALAHRRKLRVPEDLSIAGFDDSPIAIKVWPALTTVHQPVADIADLAVQKLLEAVRRQALGQSLDTGTSYLDYYLVERASTTALA